MAERSPSRGNWTSLRRTISATETEIPVDSTASLAAAPNKAWVGEEVVAYAALTAAGGVPYLSGCTRDPATARVHRGGARVVQVEWSGVEEVAELPEATANRWVYLPPRGINPGTINFAVEVGEGVYQWVALNLQDPGRDASVEFSLSVGSLGSGTTQMHGPTGVARDATGNVYVCDYYNNRIKKYTAGGSFVANFGSFGTGNGSFDGPLGIHVDSAGAIFVADSRNSRIQKFDSAFVFVAKQGSFGSSTAQYNDPQDITSDSLGNLYVSDSSNYRVKKIGPDLAYIAVVGSNGSGPGQFKNLSGIVYNPTTGFIYVVDSLNSRVQVFDTALVYQSSFSSSGNANGELNNPDRIDVDNGGNLWVTDWGNHRVQVFAPDGTFLSKFGLYGSKPPGMNYPSGVGVHEDGTVFVSQFSGDRLHRYLLTNETGNPVAVAVNGGLIGVRPRLNVVPAGLLTATATDDAANERVDLTLGYTPVVTIRDVSTNISAGADNTDTRSCNAGEVVVGCGCQMGSPTNATIRRVYAQNATTCICTAKNGSTSTQSMTTQAICLRVAP